MRPGFLPAACCLLTSATGQQLSRPDFGVESRLVLVPVTVMDRRGSFVNGLPRDAFNVTEEGVAQQIRAFQQTDAPVSVGIVLDLSGSMKGVADTAKEALRRFAATSNPGDEGFLNIVSTRPREWPGFSDDFDELLNQVSFEPAFGSTALIDTIWVSLDHIRAGHNSRRALLVVSDGMDNHSRHSRGELLERAMESDLQIYAVTVHDPPPNLKAAGLVEQQHGLLLMQDLAGRTGGLQFLVRNRSEIESSIVAISGALRNEYSIGYVPCNPDQAGKWRRIRVRVNRNGLKAYARSGYRIN